MANQITDNRTLVSSGESATGWDFPNADTEIFIQGSGSLGEQISNSRKTVFYNAGSTQDWSDNVFYIWINCGIVGLLDTKANGGFTIRFTGSNANDFFEFYVGGSDSWPTAVEGGWVQFVVDIEATSSNTGGTPPATTAIQRVGYSAVTAGTMTRNTDNTWVDEIRRLPDGNPGIIVEGRNGGATDWSFDDIVSELGVSAGTAKNGPGGSILLNTPIQFGINDTTTHGFTDTNKVILWEDQEFAPSDLYGFSALGNSGGTTNVTFGIKSGTGDDATGAQGVTISASSGGVRWDMDFDDPDLDLVGLYGCSFQHGGDFQLDDPAVSAISSFYIDCTSATVSNSEQLRVSVVNANTADGVAFMTTDDLSDIVFSNFQFSDGHGLELTTPRVATQSNKGNTFDSYGADATNDAAIYNNSGGAVTINVLDGGDTPTVRNGTSASTTVNNAVTISITVTDTSGTAIENARVYITATGGGDLADGTVILTGLTNSSGVLEDTGFNFTNDQDITGRVRKSSASPYYKTGPIVGTITSSGFSSTIQMLDDE